MESNRFYFAIDRGGTFTDIYAKCPDGKNKVMKLLSIDPTNYDDAPREGIRRILEQVKIIFILCFILYFIIFMTVYSRISNTL
jgi:N-methylhydantoinase A/oxoprolinase/acetone carboxylase beta subunit